MQRFAFVKRNNDSSVLSYVYSMTALGSGELKAGFQQHFLRFLRCQPW
jgi:hypothetical protein